MSREFRDVGDGYTFQNVVGRHAANGGIGIADGAMFVFLILEDVRIDRSRGELKTLWPVFSTLGTSFKPFGRSH